MQKVTDKVISIANISTNEEELWAYCMEFYNSNINKKVFTFRKILPSKIGIDEKSKSFLKTIFNTQSQQLALLKEETINLDEQIDCIYVDDTFFVIKKACFEQIVGLQEEFHDRAKAIAEQMIKLGVLQGGEKLQELIERKPSIHKKLIKVEKIGTYKELTPNNLKKMKSVCKKYGESLKISNGKFTFENEVDIDIALKALGDYYKIGEVSGKPYGTFAGKELKTNRD